MEEKPKVIEYHFDFTCYFPELSPEESDLAALQLGTLILQVIEEKKGYMGGWYAKVEDENVDTND